MCAGISSVNGMFSQLLRNFQNPCVLTFLISMPQSVAHMRTLHQKAPSALGSSAIRKCPVKPQSAKVFPARKARAALKLLPYATVWGAGGSDTPLSRSLHYKKGEMLASLPTLLIVILAFYRKAPSECLPGALQHTRRTSTIPLHLWNLLRYRFAAPAPLY